MTAAYGGTMENYGCQDWVAPDQCSPMNWYCDGWCQEACKDGWSLTWEWNQEAADAGDWENAHTTVCQKCVVPGDAKPGKLSVFVWESSSNKRICAVGEPVHKEPKPDALRNDWGYDWCEWPAQMDWNKPEEGCFEPSCPNTGYDPQWGQLAGGGGAAGSGEDYGQVCLDQEPQEELGCPPGMGVMSVWEEGEEMNQWGYYNWVENKYCVKTREMKSLHTPRDDLHKVFHYFDWIVHEEEEGEEPIEDFPEEAITEDFDTTDGAWVEKIEEPHVYEGSEEEFLADSGFGTDFSDENEHVTEDFGEWEEEHHFEDPNLYTDSGMFDETADGTLYADSGFWDTEEWGTELPATEHYEEAAWEGSGTGYDTAAGTGYDTAAGTYDNYETGAGNYETGAAGTYDTAEWDSGKHEEPAATTEGTATGYGSGFKRKHKKHRHHRRRKEGYGSGHGPATHHHHEPAMDATFYDSGFAGDFHEPAATFEGDFYGSGDYGYDAYPPMYEGDFYGSGDYGYDATYWPTNDFGDYEQYEPHFAGYGSGEEFPPMDATFYDSGFAGDFHHEPATHHEPADMFYGSGMPAKRRHKRHSRHH